MLRLTALGGALVAALVLAAPAAAAPTYVAGSSGSGDPFFPFAGNGGYDVEHYSLDLDYDQPANVLRGSATIEATATQNLRRFNLDLRDFYAISSVTVDGRTANIARPGAQELQISPARNLNRGSDFTVTVVYSGRPKPIKDPDKRSRAGSRPTTAPSSSTSRRGRPGGTR